MFLCQTPWKKWKHPWFPALFLMSLAQLHRVEASHGWFFWNWRDGAGVAWDRLLGVDVEVTWGFSSMGGVPQIAGWLISWKIPRMDDDN